MEWAVGCGLLFGAMSGYIWAEIKARCKKVEGVGNAKVEYVIVYLRSKYLVYVNRRQSTVEYALE